MLATLEEQAIARDVAASVHAQNFREAAQRVCDACNLAIRIKDDDPAKCVPVLQNYLHVLMNSGGMEEAAQLLWTPTQFTPAPKSVFDIWNLFDTSSMGLLMGGASMSKSYSMGVRLFLEWVRDPQYTTIKLLGPSQDHLEQNLFSHMIGLHQKASLPMPGETGELFIGLDRRNQYSAIKGLIIPIGKTKKAGRLQGTKCIPRKNPHPVFGSLSRLFIFIDEIENVPGGLWSDIDNILSNIDGANLAGGLKLFGAYNPTNQTDEVGKRAEPTFGWDNFNPDEHYRWKSIRGWDVLRLDGERSENVVQGKIVFPGLQTRGGLEVIARNAGGRNSPGYFSMGRGAYPPSGIELTVIPPGMLSKWRGEFIWYDAPQPCLGGDLALEGGARAVMVLGKCGKASGMKLPPSLEFPDGRTVMFRDKNGQVVPRTAMQANQVFFLPKGDTLRMKDEIIGLARRAGVKPEYCALDRTGHGQGTYDLIKHEWSTGVTGVNYSESPSVGRLFLEDTQTCAEAYDRVHTELWFATRYLGEYGYFLINPSIDMAQLTPQLTQRKFRTSGKKVRVESKKEFMSRGFQSPDEADGLTLFVHAARKGSGASFSMTGEQRDGESGDEGWLDGDGAVRIDSTNRSDYLDEDRSDLQGLYNGMN